MPKSNYYGSNSSSNSNPKKDKYDKPSLGDKAILAMLRLKKKLTGKGKKKKKADPTTMRTRQVISDLKRSGISDEAIARMRGKKK